ncbi:saccharopine dehydrogenase NADP-binding domain-containing protein [Mycobacterium sp. NPDC050853]|uniref:saccharopine dehydrogenase family protein n=1 Tax=Mycobacterium sp. NPDC050853 TaxID=3155160 RepID=UPI003404C6FD
MRVIALGGPGAMGAVAARVTALRGDIDELVIADRDLAAAELLAAQLDSQSSTHVNATRVDVTDTAMLRAALDDADIVVNTVGPYYRLGLAVLQAAIETRTHYIDICDDWEPTIEMLALDGSAREAGVCAVVGMGASPGVSNLLATHAARELDALEDIYTAWPVDVAQPANSDDPFATPDGNPTAAALHWMQQISGTVAVVRSGALTHEPPLQAIQLGLPGDRAGTAYTVGHPEPITLSRTLRPTGASANLMLLKPATAAYLDAIRRDIDRGLLTNDTAARLVHKPTLVRGMRALWQGRQYATAGTLPHFFAAATGRKAGRPWTSVAHIDPIAMPPDMAEATGVPLALGLSQLLVDSARTPGVHPPETAIDPAVFFSDLAAHVGRDSVVVAEQGPAA